jgi:hypothetical protein
MYCFDSVLFEFAFHATTTVAAVVAVLLVRQVETSA